MSHGVLVTAFDTSADHWLCLALSNGWVQIFNLNDEEEVQRVYMGCSAATKWIRFGKHEDVIICAFKTGVIGLVRHALHQQPFMVRLDALETSSITAIVLAESSFYVGTNLGIVSKFQWVTKHSFSSNSCFFKTFRKLSPTFRKLRVEWRRSVSSNCQQPFIKWTGSLKTIFYSWPRHFKP